MAVSGTSEGRNHLTLVGGTSDAHGLELCGDFGSLQGVMRHRMRIYMYLVQLSELEHCQEQSKLHTAMADFDRSIRYIRICKDQVESEDCCYDSPTSPIATAEHALVYVELVIQ